MSHVHRIYTQQIDGHHIMTPHSSHSTTIYKLNTTTALPASDLSFIGHFLSIAQTTRNFRHCSQPPLYLTPDSYCIAAILAAPIPSTKKTHINKPFGVPQPLSFNFVVSILPNLSSYSIYRRYILHTRATAFPEADMT